MFPPWLNFVAILWLVLAIFSAIIIFIDIQFFRKPPMKIMILAWPINALYFSIIALVFYFWFGRNNKNQQHMSMDNSHAMMNMEHDMSNMSPNKNSIPKITHLANHQMDFTWKNLFKTGTHCGSGCTLADIIGEFIVLFIPIMIAGSHILGSWILDFILALIIGIFFQYLPNREMKIPRLEALKKAIQSDSLSVISWQIGMYIWMALVFFVFFSPNIDRLSAVYWFMMQIAMIVGFFTAYPMNWFLTKKGIKMIM